MSTQTAADSCEICGRASEPASGRLCLDCAELVQAPSPSRAPGWWRTWAVTLLLLIAGAAVYAFVGKHYFRDIFWWLLVGRTLR